MNQNDGVVSSFDDMCFSFTDVLVAMSSIYELELINNYLKLNDDLELVVYKRELERDIYNIQNNKSASLIGNFDTFLVQWEASERNTEKIYNSLL